MTEEQPVEQRSLWWKGAMIGFVAGLVVGLLYKVIGIVAGGEGTEPDALPVAGLVFPMLIVFGFYRKEHPGIIGFAYGLFTTFSAAFLSMGLYEIAGQLCDGFGPGDGLRLLIWSLPLALGAIMFLKAPQRTHPLVVGAVAIACALSLGLAAGVCLSWLF